MNKSKNQFLEVKFSFLFFNEYVVRAYSLISRIITSNRHLEHPKIKLKLFNIDICNITNISNLLLIEYLNWIPEKIEFFLCQIEYLKKVLVRWTVGLVAQK